MHRWPSQASQALTASIKASTSWLTTSDWLELANDAFYLIGSAVFQCMEYHESKTEDFIFRFSKC
jgi:hypothetical protein